MLVWVVILVVLSGLLFAQNVSMWENWQLPPIFRLTILWSVLILLVALGILVSLILERKARGRLGARRKPAASGPPPAPEPDIAPREPKAELRQEPAGGPKPEAPAPPRESPTEEPKEPSF